ncbi:unnamed protein product [Owenia fusiformis]|uniref:Uncharacterized protein n=1 Tax=Owenia fusiformis TaxID=6347 RepID=A0A8J1TRH4_OWEFU|nr:unnamed protein product [Owenia fusiformis]
MLNYLSPSKLLEPPSSTTPSQDQKSDMGRKINLNHLDETECERILNVIQRDFELRQSEKERLSKIEEEIRDEKTKVNILAKQQNFNDNCCMRCFSTFFFIFNRRVQCYNCKFFVCKNCSGFDKHQKEYICKICEKQIELATQSCEWFYANVRQKFKRFGSAKVVRSLYKRKSGSDSENDSGYDPSLYNSLPQGKKYRESVRNLFPPEQENIRGPNGSSRLNITGGQVSYRTLDPNSNDNTVHLSGEEAEKRLFQDQLDNITHEIYGTLDGQHPDDLANPEQSQDVLSTQRVNVRDALVNLTQGLSRFRESSTDDDNSEENTTEAKRIVTQMVEEFVGGAIDIDVDDVLASDSSDNKCYEDILADAIVKKISLDHRKVKERLSEVEVEADEGNDRESPRTSPSQRRKHDSPRRNHDTPNKKPLTKTESEDTEDRLNKTSEFVKCHEVPLPSFVEGIEDVDITDLVQKNLDISDTDSQRKLPKTTEKAIDQLQNGDNNLEDDVDSPEGAELLLQGGSMPQNWKKNWFFTEKNIVSPYDNFGDKKVGAEDVVMLVPKLDESPGPKIGDKDLDEVSELSERSRRSSIASISSLSSSEEEQIYLEELAATGELRQVTNEIVREFLHTDEEIQTEDFVIQTDTEEIETTTMPIAKRAVASCEIATMTDEDGLRKSAQLYVKDEKDQIMREMLQTTLIPLGTSEDDETDPRFVVRPMNVTVPEGEPAKFTCQVAGSEPLDVFWYKSGSEMTELEDGAQCEIYREGDIYHLDVFNTTKKASGQYLCIGVNDEGRCVHSFKITLEANPLELKVPEFIKPIEDIEIIEGQTAKFRCKLKGYPIPRVLWYKDGKRIQDSLEQRIEKLGNRGHSLTMGYATIDDDAEYTVVATNTVGQVKMSAQLLVEPAPKMVEIEMKSPAVTEENKANLNTLADRMVKTQSNVTDTAENVLTSADDLSEINKQLDEMDRKLNNMEVDVHTALSPSPQIEDVVLDDDNNNFAYDMEVKKYQEMTKAAKNVREVTSTALGVISSTEQKIEAEKDRQMQGTTSKVSPSPKQEKRKYELESPSEPLPISPNKSYDEILNRPQLSFEEFEKQFGGGKVEPLKVNTSEEMDTLSDMKAHELSMDDLPDKIDCGLKRVDSQRYKRDFHVSSSKPKQTKWAVKTPSPTTSPRGPLVRATPAAHREDPHEEIQRQEEDAWSPPLDNRDWTTLANSTEDEIYMTAGQVFNYEDRVGALEKKVGDIDGSTSDKKVAALEDQVARAVAQVSQTEQSVGDIERNVAELSKQGSQKIRGSTERDQIPVTSGEFDEESIPSVKHLLGVFKDGDDKDMGDGNFKRVHSLTARNPRKSFQEQMRAQFGFGGGPKPANYGAPQSPEYDSAPPKWSPRSTPSPQQSPSASPRQPTATVAKQQQSPQLQSKQPQVAKSPREPQQTQPPKRIVVTKKTPAGPPAKLSAPKKNKQSSIMARAAFWNQRIETGAAKDDGLIEEYPELSQDTFKTDAELY